MQKFHYRIYPKFILLLLVLGWMLVLTTRVRPPTYGLILGLFLIAWCARPLLAGFMNPDNAFVGITPAELVIRFWTGRQLTVPFDNIYSLIIYTSRSGVGWGIHCRGRDELLPRRVGLQVGGLVDRAGAERLIIERSCLVRSKPASPFEYIERYVKPDLRPV